AGDIGDPSILKSLSNIAPVLAVRGNNDTQAWAAKIPLTQSLVFSDVSVFVIHDVKTLRAESLPAGTRVVVAGHSHKPTCEEREGIFWVNPGSAGRRRFKLPIAVGELLIGPEASVTVNLRELDV